MSKNSNSLDFIFKAKLIHGDKYIYDKVNYNKAIEKVEIICKEHGSFFQTPANHLTGYGCRKCNHSSKKRTLTLNEFIEKSNKIHKNKYIYDKFNYINNYTKSTIICPIHGEFEQPPKAHLIGKGCKKCGTHSMIDKQTMKNEEFLKRAINVHGNKYDYTNTKYISKFKKVAISCKIHGIFNQQANNHLLGNGCPTCAKIVQNYYFRISNEQADKIPCTLYLVNISDNVENFYKIGISSNIKDRFRQIKHLYKVKIIFEFNTNLQDAITLETMIIKKYKDIRYTPLKLFDGQTECFSNNLNTLEISILCN